MRKGFIIAAGVFLFLPFVIWLYIRLQHRIYRNYHHWHKWLMIGVWIFSLVMLILFTLLAIFIK